MRIEVIRTASKSAGRAADRTSDRTSDRVAGRAADRASDKAKAQSGGRFDVFSALEQDKRQRIIDAALKEFAEKGFKQASTNVIAANAQIGKGMLFYYFNRKEELFDFLCEYAIEFVRREYLDLFEGNTGDFIERQRRLALAKRRAFEREPLLYALFMTFYNGKNSEQAVKYVDTLASLRKEFYQKLYEDLDYSLFRPDIEPNTTMRYISWLLDGYTEYIMQKLRQGDLDTVEADEWTRFDSFIDDLKKLFYNCCSRHDREERN